MYSLLLIIIYLSFISLGLPDSLLGSAWPVIQEQLNVPISYAGIITMIIAFGTIISSLFSNHLTNKLGSGLVTSISVLLTAIALLGFSYSDKFFKLCLWAIPYGLGAGAVDATLNNYVALHYKSRHMNWLHCFWGVGASISPYIMSYSLINGTGWNSGYEKVFVIQIVLTTILFISLPLWKRKNKSENEKKQTTSIKEAIKINGVKLVLLFFFAYCALEQTTGLWASSYLVHVKNVEKNLAAFFGSLFFIGITVGRAVSGFVSDKLGDKSLIRIGLITIFLGIVLVLLPINNSSFSLGGLMIIGLGCAPIYPAIIHSTPSNFGKENSQAIIGIQMASAYIGTTFMPPLFGLISQTISIKLYPLYLMIFLLIMILMSEKLNENNDKKQRL